MRSNQIGDRLRQMYDDIVHEDVPEDFLKLLEDADKKRTSSEGA